MIENTQNYTNTAGLERLPILINLQKEYKTGMILTPSGGKFIVRLADWLVKGIQLHDFVEVKRDHVTGELTVVDYFVNYEATDSFVTGYDEKYGIY